MSVITGRVLVWCIVMNVSLTRELEKFVNTKVESGRYNSRAKSSGKPCVSWRNMSRRGPRSLQSSIGSLAAAWTRSTAASTLTRPTSALGSSVNPRPPGV